MGKSGQTLLTPIESRMHPNRGSGGVNGIIGCESRLLTIGEIVGHLTTICCVISIDTILHLYYSRVDKAGRFALGTGEIRKNQRNRAKYFRISETAENKQ